MSKDKTGRKVSQAEFARMQGWSRSHVTGLKKDGRLVTEEKGKRVLVLMDESLARIEATKDPNRDDVSKRHAAERAGEVEQQPAAPEDEAATMSYQKARAKKEHYLAAQAETEFRKQIGELVDVAAVKKAGVDLGAYLRTSMENMVDQMSSELAVISDPALVHSTMSEHVEHVLGELSRKLQSGLGGE